MYQVAPLAPSSIGRNGRRSCKIMSLSKTESGGSLEEEYEYLGQWEEKMSSACTRTAAEVYGVSGTLPEALLGQLICLLATSEVRVRMGKTGPTTVPQGSQRPSSGDDDACFIALDPSAAWGTVCKTSFNQPLHHNRLRSLRISMSSGLTWCLWLLF